MRKEIDLSTYSRKPQYDFFKEFEEPFFGVTVSLNCTKAYDYTRQNEIPFFPFYLWQTSRAVNKIANFRHRIIEDKLVEFERIDISATMARPDKTFGFSYIEHDEKFEVFLENFKKEKERIFSSRELFPSRNSEQVVHYSALPWLDFSSLSHARRFAVPDSCPKISFGKLREDKSMSVSIHAHHALVDGYHIGLLVDLLQEFMENPG